MTCPQAQDNEHDVSVGFAANGFPCWMEEWRQEIDAALAQYTEFDADCPPLLRDAIRYSLLAPAKRLRPLVVLLSAKAVGGQKQQAMPAACAVEMVHTYSLIHDDLPAMDNDDVRRGRPTCHVQFGEAMAILAGDALLARAFGIIAEEIRPADVAARCCVELAQAAGASALVGGQVDDLYVEERQRTREHVENIHRRKTGALFVASARLGALTAGAHADQLAALTQYGQHVGLAFQVVDDLLDVHGSQQMVGKRTGKDQQQGKVTYPSIVGVEASRRRVVELVRAAVAAIMPLGEDAQPLQQLAQFVMVRSF